MSNRLTVDVLNRVLSHSGLSGRPREVAAIKEAHALGWQAREAELDEGLMRALADLRATAAGVIEQAHRVEACLARKTARTT